MVERHSTAGKKANSNQLQFSASVIDRINSLQRDVYEFIDSVLQSYAPDELMLSFNGGKDCTVILDLIYKYFQEHKIDIKKITVLYIEQNDNFIEIDEFVDDCILRYGLNLIKYRGSLKEALTRMCTDNPRIKAVFIGSRNTDPYCEKLTPMQPTDNGWPALIRLSPILDWSYHDIWHYLLNYQVPYCKLYDMGYTSLGNKLNTKPNSHLRLSAPGNDAANHDDNGDATVSYRPAYELEDGTLERCGRGMSNTQK